MSKNSSTQIDNLKESGPLAARRDLTTEEVQQARAEFFKRFRRQQVIGQRVGGDFGMEVKLGKPGGGSYFEADSNSFTLDPLHIADNPEKADFVTSHEGGHRATMVKLKELGLTEAQERAYYGQIGFGFIQNITEDGACNDWKDITFPGLEEGTQHFYDEQFENSDAVLSTPEVVQIYHQLGRWPLFARYGSEILRDWHERRKQHGLGNAMPPNEGGYFSPTTPPIVREALDRSIGAARRCIATIPPAGCRDRQIIKQKHQLRFKTNADEIYSEVRELVNLDLGIETGRQAFNEFQQKIGDLKDLEQKLKEAKAGKGGDAETIQQEIDKLQEELTPYQSIPKQVRDELERAAREVIKKQIHDFIDRLKKSAETLGDSKERQQKLNDALEDATPDSSEAKDLENELQMEEAREEQARRELEQDLDRTLGSSQAGKDLAKAIKEKIERDSEAHSEDGLDTLNMPKADSESAEKQESGAGSQDQQDTGSAGEQPSKQSGDAPSSDSNESGQSPDQGAQSGSGSQGGSGGGQQAGGGASPGGAGQPGQSAGSQQAGASGSPSGSQGADSGQGQAGGQAGGASPGGAGQSGQSAGGQQAGGSGSPSGSPSGSQGADSGQGQAGGQVSGASPGGAGQSGQSAGGQQAGSSSSQDAQSGKGAASGPASQGSAEPKNGQASDVTGAPSSGAESPSEQPSSDLETTFGQQINEQVAKDAAANGNMPIPYEELSPEAQQAVEKMVGEIPDDQFERCNQKAQENLKKFEEAANQALEPNSPPNSQQSDDPSGTGDKGEKGGRHEGGDKGNDKSGEDSKQSGKPSKSQPQGGSGSGVHDDAGLAPVKPTATGSEKWGDDPEEKSKEKKTPSKAPERTPSVQMELPDLAKTRSKIKEITKATAQDSKEFAQAENAVTKPLDILKGRFRKILQPTLDQELTSGHAVGRADMKKVMRLEREPGLVRELFDRWNDPVEIDHAFGTLVDRSDSMKGLNALEAHKAAILQTKLLDWERLKVPNCVWVFSDDVANIKDFNEKITSPAIRQRFGAILRVTGGTNDADALWRMYNYLVKRPEKFKFMPIITDTGTGQLETLRAVTDEIKKQGKVILVHFGLGPNTQDSTGVYPYSFGNLSVDSGSQVAGDLSFPHIYEAFVASAVRFPRRFFEYRDTESIVEAITREGQKKVKRSST